MPLNNNLPTTVPGRLVDRLLRAQLVPIFDGPVRTLTQREYRSGSLIKEQVITFNWENLPESHVIVYMGESGRHDFHYENGLLVRKTYERGEDYMDTRFTWNDDGSVIRTDTFGTSRYEYDPESDLLTEYNTWLTATGSPTSKIDLHQFYADGSRILYRSNTDAAGPTNAHVFDRHNLEIQYAYTRSSRALHVHERDAHGNPRKGVLLAFQHRQTDWQDVTWEVEYQPS